MTKDFDRSGIDNPQPYNKIGDGPEGPEVKIITDCIEKKYKCATLYNVVINSGRYAKHKKPDGYAEFLKTLPAKIISFNTKGKFIWLELEDEKYIWITLGLTGILRIQPDKHSHITFETSKGDFYMDDMRNFGTIKFSFSKSDLDKKLKTLGFNPLDKPIDDKICVQRLRKVNQNKMIALVLNDQKTFSGIGNYLRAEILYHAKISPYKKIKDLSDKNLKDICNSINYIINKSYQIQLKNGLHSYHFEVYQKDVTKKNEKIVGEDLEGRTIWWVPTVQK